MTSGRLSLRLVAPATLYAAFIPLAEIAGLALVWRRRDALPFARTIDLFFRSHMPPLLWLLLFAAIWGFLPTPAAIYWTALPWARQLPILLFLLWSALLDFRFFRRILSRRPLHAATSLVLQRAVAWSLGIAWFVGPAAWQAIAAKVGL